MSLARRCVVRIGHRFHCARRLHSTRATDRLNIEEKYVQAEERHRTLDAASWTNTPNETKNVIDLLGACTSIKDLTPHQIFRCKDIENQLATQNFKKFLTLVVDKLAGHNPPDRWTGGFLMALHSALKKYKVERPPLLDVQAAFERFETTPTFAVETACVNSMITVMYQERTDIAAIYAVYGHLKANNHRPSHQTFPLMFSASLRAHKMKNAQNFFDASTNVLTNENFSFDAKVDVLTALLLGISDAQASLYANQLIVLLRDECLSNKTGFIPPCIPEKPSERRTMHLYLSERVATQVLGALTRIRNSELHDHVRGWADFLRGRTTKGLNTAFMTRLMRIHATNGDLDRAFETWNELQATPDDSRVSDLSSFPVRAACNYLLDTVAKSRKEEYVKQASDLIENMISKKVLNSDLDRIDAYVMQIKLHCMSDRYEEAKNVYFKIASELVDHRMMDAFCVSRSKVKDNINILHEVFEDFKLKREANLHSKNKFTEDKELALGTDRYLSVLADAGELKRALAVAGNVTLETGHRLLQACAKDKDASQYGTFYKWSEDGQDEMPLYFSHLKNPRTTKANCKVAQGIFDKMQENEDIKVETKTYNLLIAVYSAARDHDSVTMLYEQMQEAKLKPDHLTYYYLARSFADKGMVDQIESVFSNLFQDLDKSKSKSFNADFVAQTIRALSNTGMRIETVAYMRRFNPGEECDDIDWSDDQPAKIVVSKQPRDVEVEAGFRFLTALKDVGLHPTEKVYTALLSLCTRAGAFKRAEEVYKLMSQEERSGLRKTDVVTALMKMHYTRDNMDDAMQLLVEVFQADEGALDHTAYHNCISTCSAKGHIDNAKRVLEIMLQDSKVKVTDTAIAMAIVACAHADGSDDERLSVAKGILTEYR
ncbi:hypothetical protein DIPPA_04562a, partial [Diplonema papillatum]